MIAVLLSRLHIPTILDADQELITIYRCVLRDNKHLGHRSTHTGLMPNTHIPCYTLVTCWSGAVQNWPPWSSAWSSFLLTHLNTWALV